MRRLGFTLLELIFVIVVMGILAKFGVEFLGQAYSSFIYSSVNNSLQAKSATAVETIASKLQYRIKDSIIAKKTNGDFKALASSDYGTTATILEWVGNDIENFRGNSMPNWSAIIDLDASTATILNSPETNTTAIDDLIGVLSHGSGTGMDNAAIYFIGSNTNINDYGWGITDTAFTDQSKVMHPVKAGAAPNELVPRNADDDSTNSFTGVDVYEYYQLAWTAYAVVHSEGNLTLHYDYQPWEGERYTSGKTALLMEDVSTFQFRAVGSIVKIQVCTESDIIDGNVDGGYSLCKEKTVY